MKLVLATGNQGKVKELREILENLDVQLLSLKDFPEMGEIVEDGLTFAENAIKKARAVSDFTGLAAMADDSGLEVDYLDGAPGVYSARFAGEGKSDLANNQKLLKMLEGVPDESRTAKFRCVIAISVPGGEVYTAEGICMGRIGCEARGNEGFGYDPLFIVPQYGKTFAELEPSLKNNISHRGRALAKIGDVLEQLVKRAGVQ